MSDSNPNPTRPNATPSISPRRAQPIAPQKSPLPQNKNSLVPQSGSSAPSSLAGRQFSVTDIWVPEVWDPPVSEVKRKLFGRMRNGGCAVLDPLPSSVPHQIFSIQLSFCFSSCSQFLPSFESTTSVLPFSPPPPPPPPPIEQQFLCFLFSLSSSPFSYPSSPLAPPPFPTPTNLYKPMAYPAASSPRASQTFPSPMMASSSPPSTSHAPPSSTTPSNTTLPLPARSPTVRSALFLAFPRRIYFCGSLSLEFASTCLALA
jgi:hypothetical protein